MVKVTDDEVAEQYENQMIHENDDGMRNRGGWCFTYHNYTEEILEILENHKDIRFVMYGKEVCPETGTRHLQGWVYWIYPKTRKAQQKIFKKSVFWRFPKALCYKTKNTFLRMETIMSAEHQSNKVREIISKCALNT